MGYFGKQIYNEPMSMYVDPKLDILANSLGAVQKRHDENYATMSAMDIAAHNMKVAQGDQHIKDAALGKFKTQKDAIAASGDYAYAMPKIGMAISDLSTDQTFNLAKDNEVKRQKSLEQLSALGSSGLDFNKASKNWTTIDPLTGTPREFVSGVEKRDDWDGTAQEVTKLMASERPIGLTAASLAGYLKHGKTGGISKADIENYLDKSYDRFVNGTTAGKQMYRSLTEIDDLPPALAKQRVREFLTSVGEAQVHSKTDMDYMVDSVAMKREEMAAELEKERIKAAGVEGAGLPSIYTSLLREATRTSPDGTKGTHATDEDISRLTGSTPIKIKTRQGDMNAMFVPGTKTISPTRLVPGADRLPDDIYTKGKSYYNTLSNYDKQEQEINNQLRNLNSKVTTDKPATDQDLTTLGGWGEVYSYLGKEIANAVVPAFNEGKKPFNVPSSTDINTQRKALEKKLANIQTQRTKTIEKNKPYEKVFTEHKDVFTGHKSRLIEEVGKAVENLNIPSVVDVSKTKNLNIKDGKANIQMIGFPKAEDLISLGEEKVNMLIETGALVGVTDFNDLKAKEKSTDVENSYQLYYSTNNVPVDLNRIYQSDEAHYGKDKITKENTTSLRAQASQFLNEQERLTPLINDTKDAKKGRADLLNISVAVINKYNSLTPAEKTKKINSIRRNFALFNDLSRYEKEQLIEEALIYEQEAYEYNAQLRQQ